MSCGKRSLHAAGSSLIHQKSHLTTPFHRATLFEWHRFELYGMSCGKRSLHAAGSASLTHPKSHLTTPLHRAIGKG